MTGVASWVAGGGPSPVVPVVSARWPWRAWAPAMLQNPTRPKLLGERHDDGLAAARAAVVGPGPLVAVVGDDAAGSVARLGGGGVVVVHGAVTVPLAWWGWDRLARR